MKNEIEFLRDIGKVKTIKRAGWVREGITNPESVADHSFRVAVMAMAFGDKLNVDTNKLIKLALTHDIAEGVIGDKVVERGLQIDNRARKQKDLEEDQILRQLFRNIGIDKAEQFLPEKGSEESILKQLDRLEMAMQALEYEEEFAKDLTEFFDNASHHITHPFLKQILDEIITQRPRSKI